MNHPGRALSITCMSFGPRIVEADGALGEVRLSAREFTIQFRCTVSGPMRPWIQSGDFPICEKIAAEIVSLPMYPQLVRHNRHGLLMRSWPSIAKPTRKHAEADVTALATADRTA